MNSLNRVQLIGNLTKDIELKVTQSGQSVTTVNLATNRSVKKGEVWESVPDYHQVICWGKLAEICAQYLVKGNKVYFEGRVQTRSWEDSGGLRKYKTEIVATEMIMLGQKPKEAAPTQQSEPAPEEPTPEPSIDDLPF